MARHRAPGALLGEVRQRAQQGWPAGLVVLSGDSAYHLDAAQKAILEAVAPAEAGEYGLTVYGDERVDVGTVVAACRSRGMFSERRVVLVRDLAALDGEPDVLLEYAKSPAPDSHLILRAPKIDRRRKLGKALAAHDGFLLFQKPDDPNAFVRDVRDLAEQQGLVLDRDAASLLAHACDGDLYRVLSELAKVQAWLGGTAKRIGAAELRETLAGEGALSGWELANAIQARDRTRALAAARRLVEAGEEPIKVVGGIAWRARKMLAGRDTSRYTVDELLTFPRHLLEADRALKGRQISASAVLESLVDRIVGVAPRGA